VEGVEGVRGVADGPLHRKPVRVTEDDGALAVELHLAIAWGVHVPTVGEAVQRAVADYLERMAGTRPMTIDVVVAHVEAPAPAAG
jgi:uncharacterized alkaline shock family protein YloU